MEIWIRPAAAGDLDEIEELYGVLGDFLAGCVNGPR